MPDWRHPYDPYNNYNTTDNFNPYGIIEITPDIMARCFPFEACFTCDLGHKTPLKACYGTKICKLRIKDKHNPTYVITKGRQPGEPKSLAITMRSGQMTWNYYHQTKVIFRAGNETGTALHHRDGNPFNNSGENMAVVNTHEQHHGFLRSFNKSLKELEDICNYLQDDKPLKRAIAKLEKVYEYMHDIPDDPRVFKIIEVFDKYRKGYITKEEGEAQLEKLNASIPSEILEKYDMRKIKYNNEHILEYERRREDAVQGVQFLVV